MTNRDGRQGRLVHEKRQQWQTMDEVMLRYRTASFFGSSTHPSC
ncbi:hypothetical protein ACU4GD_27850 [Cupriavidus basilensis]